MALRDVKEEHYGLVPSAYFNQLSFSNLVLKGEGCFISLGKRRSYDRLNLHFFKYFAIPLYIATREELVIIVEVCPSGLATSACLKNLSYLNQGG
ncbi:hypothetical protein AMTRI_Chr03g143370 [Amborella trichopoda]